jgi:hypothetical protein
MRRFSLLLACLAVATASFVLLDFWSSRNAPPYLKFERLWQEDVEQLEKSGKLPKGWSDLKDIEVIGGTAETKKWLRLVTTPIKTTPNGKHRMDVLVVVWEEDGVRGVMVQYNLEDLKTKNNIWELGRTFILSRPTDKKGWSAFVEGFLQ